jgi:HK97 family phage prohead protease
MASDLKYGKGSALWDYWTKGKGAAKWIGAVHKWTMLHGLLVAAGVPASEADGLTTNIIEAVFPGYMAQAHKKGHRSMTTSYFTRSFPLDDIRVRSGGDGRTVEAYASVFDTPTEIRDRDGHYYEVISRSAFDKTIAERGTRFGVFFNHGLTLHGTPSERHSMPIGTPLEVRADGRGVLTVTRYNKTPLADEVLEAINSGAITGQSFSGRMIQSNPRRGPFRPRNGELPTVTRTEIAMREYGPTPMPAYEDAAIVGVRAALAHRFDDLSDEQLAELLRMLDPITPDGAGGEPGTPEQGAVAAEPEPEQGHHSGPHLVRAQARARLLKMGILL